VTISKDTEKFLQECQVSNIANFIDKCNLLHNILVETNKNINLTRITSEEDFLYKHVLDSVAIARYFPEIANEELNIADIGCGAGFPSLVLGIAFPQLAITSIDSTGKKINFVASTANLLGTKNLKAIHGRANELNRKGEFLFNYDIVTARAVATAPELYKSTFNFLRSTGRYIFYKTPKQANEDIPNLTFTKLDWQTTQTFETAPGIGERLFLYAQNKENSKQKK
jgi:16S rRNA (guanine527-N7)-methyltransferase